jgi:hypothetical protein
VRSNLEIARHSESSGDIVGGLEEPMAAGAPDAADSAACLSPSLGRFSVHVVSVSADSAAAQKLWAKLEEACVKSEHAQSLNFSALLTPFRPQSSLPPQAAALKRCATRVCGLQSTVLTFPNHTQRQTRPTVRQTLADGTYTLYYAESFVLCVPGLNACQISC